MKKIILALGAMQPPEMEALDSRFHVVKLWKEKNPEEILQSIRTDVQVILSTYNGIPVTRRMIESFPNLELIAQYGVGVNNIDLIAAKERAIAVTSTPDSPTTDTADTALALMLGVARRFVEGDMFVRVGKWVNAPFPIATSLTHKRVGICGFGRIGQAIARRCAAFDMVVSYHTPRPKPDQPYTYFSTLKEMAEAVDFLVMACPGGPSTHHIVNADILAALGKKGFLINIARGSVVDTDALLIALRNRAIAGAGLDVYENEPHVPEALISMDNVVLLPHIGGGTIETRTSMGQVVLSNIFAHFDGMPLVSPVAIY